MLSSFPLTAGGGGAVAWIILDNGRGLRAGKNCPGRRIVSGVAWCFCVGGICAVLAGGKMSRRRFYPCAAGITVAPLRARPWRLRIRTRMRPVWGTCSICFHTRALCCFRFWGLGRLSCRDFSGCRARRTCRNRAAHRQSGCGKRAWRSGGGGDINHFSSEASGWHGWDRR